MHLYHAVKIVAGKVYWLGVMLGQPVWCENQADALEFPQCGPVVPGGYDSLVFSRSI